jgi:hypothetical protein
VSILDGPGVLLGDEIEQSGNPAQHASDLIATMQRERIPWVALQITTDPRKATSIRDLQLAAQRRGYGSVGTWAQHLPPSWECNWAVTYGSRFHLVNVESAPEDAAWKDNDLDYLRNTMKDGVAVVFTEGAWGRDSTKSKRWRDRGYAAIPEAIESENPQATITAMFDLALDLQWLPSQIAPCLYLTRGYPAGNYDDQIGTTQGRWSIFRYGDIDPSDWTVIQGWPRPAAMPNPTPPPPPPPPPPVLPGISVDQGHRVHIDTVLDVQERVEALGQTLGRRAAHTIIRRSSDLALDRLWTKELGEKIAVLLDEAGAKP